ncbi:sensor histidine kinase, partial [Actinocrinis sp.]|uniref:sensor histidine kinase n=1 Tax=Actinocrinis sp. TaxID=1920516 RepID=UPI002DDD03AE
MRIAAYELRRADVMNPPSAHYGRSVASSPETKEVGVVPTVLEPVSDQAATTQPDGSGFEWPRAIRLLLAAFRGHPYRQDVLLSLCVLLLTFVPQSGTRAAPQEITPLLLITSATQSLALIWRRKAPFAVYCVVLAACTVQWAAAESSGSNVSLMISLFTLARYWSLRRLLVVAGAGVPSLFVLVFRVELIQDHALLNVFFLSTAIAASIALGLVARERHAQLEALAERAAHAEFDREQRAHIAVLAERARFSREMHDILGHTLAVITGLADGGVRQVEANPERGRQVFELIGDTSRIALADLRRTLGALRERPLDERVEEIGVGAETLTPQPGVADISALLERTRSAGPRVSCRIDGEPTALPRSLQLAIYRIVQESLTNSLKHAGPDTSVQVAIEVGEQSLRVSVSDTGSEPRRAAPSAPGSGSPGQGLTGVRERAALAGGRAEAGPNIAGG